MHLFDSLGNQGIKATCEHPFQLVTTFWSNNLHRLSIDDDLSIFYRRHFFLEKKINETLWKEPCLRVRFTCSCFHLLWSNCPRVFYSFAYIYCFYRHPWEDVTKAVFSKYPNPISTHVLATDVIEQRLLPDNTLLTRRLILKASKVPRWARYLVPLPHGYVVETSRVDLANKIMTLETVNLSYVRLMKTREVQTMQPCHSNPDFV